MTQLKSKITTVLITGLAAVGLAIVPVGIASAAPANPSIDRVPCGRSDFLQVWWHPDNQLPRSVETCFANGGEFTFGHHTWLDAFSTGNNSVQYESDGRWQPATPVGPNTFYTFPNHPGGVEFDAILIIP